MDVPATLRRAYLDAEVDLWLPPDDVHTVLRPAPAGIATGDFPAGVAVVHVVTAYDPASRPLPPARNAARDRALRAELAPMPARWISRAVGRDPEGTHTEASWAVADLDETSVLDLAVRHGQLAVYAWTPSARAVLWIDGSRETTGWTLTPAARGADEPTPDGR